MDFATARIRREWILLSIVLLAAVIGNLPQDMLQQFGIDRRYMLAVLGLVILIALFLYVRIFVFVLCMVLVVGANLPEQWAGGLGISTMPLLVALVVMVVGSLLNFVTKSVPSGLEIKPKKKSTESAQALIQAIDRDQAYKVKTILRMGFDPNILTDDGESPLRRAVAKGDLIMAGLLLKYGASPDIAGKDGTTPLQMAVRAGHDKIVALLMGASRQHQGTHQDQTVTG